MPHITVEYTHDLQEQIEINQLLPLIHETLLSHEGVFSASGIRSRGVMIADYFRGGDNAPIEDGFVHVILKILTGRSEDVKQKVLNHLLEVINNHLTEYCGHKNVALSIELFEFNSAGNMYVQN